LTVNSEASPVQDGFTVKSLSEKSSDTCPLAVGKKDKQSSDNMRRRRANQQFDLKLFMKDKVHHSTVTSFKIP
jgi:hypothetical protein